MSFNKELQILLEKLREPNKDLDRFDSPPSPVVHAKERPTATRPQVKEGNFFQRAASAVGLTRGTKYVKPQAPDKAIRGDKANYLLTNAQAGLQMQLDKRNAEQAQMDAIGVKKQAIKNIVGSLTPPPMGKEPTAPGKLSAAETPENMKKDLDPNAARNIGATRNDKLGNNLSNPNLGRTRTGASQRAEAPPQTGILFPKGSSTKSTVSSASGNTTTAAEALPDNRQAARPSPEQIQQQKEASITKAAAGIQGTLASVASTAASSVTRGGRLLGGEKTEPAKAAPAPPTQQAPAKPPDLAPGTARSQESELAKALRANGIKPGEYKKSEAEASAKADAESAKRKEAQAVEDKRKAGVIAKAKEPKEKKEAKAKEPKEKKKAKAKEPKASKNVTKKKEEKNA